MEFLEQADHQKLLDELRECDETRRTEIILSLTDNYTKVIKTHGETEVTIKNLTEKNVKFQQQNNELFLAATAHARAKESDQKNNGEMNKNSEEQTEFLAGMFDNRGNMIPPANS